MSHFLILGLPKPPKKKTKPITAILHEPFELTPDDQSPAARYVLEPFPHGSAWWVLHCLTSDDLVNPAHKASHLLPGAVPHLIQAYNQFTLMLRIYQGNIFKEKIKPNGFEEVTPGEFTTTFPSLKKGICYRVTPKARHHLENQTI